jgi:hypothetical protein
MDEEDQLDFGENENDSDYDDVISLGHPIEVEDVTPVVAADLAPQPPAKADEQSPAANGGTESRRPAAGQTYDEKGPLPPGWQTRISNSTKKIYYVNVNTNTSVWDRPTFDASTSDPASEPKPDARKANGSESTKVSEERKSRNGMSLVKIICFLRRSNAAFSFSESRRQGYRGER